MRTCEQRGPGGEQAQGCTMMSPVLLAPSLSLLLLARAAAGGPQRSSHLLSPRTAQLRLGQVRQQATTSMGREHKTRTGRRGDWGSLRRGRGGRLLLKRRRVGGRHDSAGRKLCLRGSARSQQKGVRQRRRRVDSLSIAHRKKVLGAETRLRRALDRSLHGGETETKELWPRGLRRYDGPGGLEGFEHCCTCYGCGVAHPRRAVCAFLVHCEMRPGSTAVQDVAKVGRCRAWRA